jgi:hypothetical protein
MYKRIKVRRPGQATIVAWLALFVALGGGAIAASNLRKNTVGTKQLKKNAVTPPKIKRNAVTTAKVRNQAITEAKVKDQAITGAKVKNGSLTGAQVDTSTLGTVPSAQVANSVAPGEPWHVVGAPGEPAFENGWTSPKAGGQPVAFYRDQLGVVHLRGVMGDGTSTDPAFQLPPGFRPRAGVVLPFAAACLPCTESGTGTLVVNTDLEPAAVEPVRAAEFYSLEGITFRAES